MNNRLVAALLLVSISGCSVIPRAAPQADTPTPSVALDMPEEALPAEDAQADARPPMTKDQRFVAAVWLVVLYSIITYAAMKNMTRSVNNICCYR